jgi:hypothetical protein
VFLFSLALMAAGMTSCSGDIISPSNSEFAIRVSGPPGVEFTGFCTHEVKYLTGSRTEETDIEGKLTESSPVLDFMVTGTEISCRVATATTGTPVTVVLIKDGEEVARMDDVEYAAYMDFYPPDIQQ